MKVIPVGAVFFICCLGVSAQQPSDSVEKRVPLTETAVAFDGSGAPALEASLRTTALNGAADSPVTNIRMVVKNSSSVSYTFVSGLVTFYDGAGVRCGEGVFRAGELSVNEAFETDTPGIRIRCTPATWRIVATNLLPRVAPLVVAPSGVSTGTSGSRTNLNLVISVDGEEHPIQLNKPMVLTLGEAQRTILVREAP